MDRPLDIPPVIWERAELLMDDLRAVKDDRELIARVLIMDRQQRQSRVGLTPKQNRALNFIGAYIGKHEVSPSYDEIAAALGLASKANVHRVVSSLIERGAITAIPAKPRSLRLTETVQ